MSLVALNRACENSLKDYIQGVFTANNYSASFYSGTDNIQDLRAPAVIIECNQGTETYWNSNVYELIVTVSAVEMCADVAANNLGVLAQEVQNCLFDPDRVSNINTNNNWHFVTLQVQNQDLRTSREEDALYNQIVVRVVGTLIP